LELTALLRAGLRAQARRSRDSLLEDVNPVEFVTLGIDADSPDNVAHCDTAAVHVLFGSTVIAERRPILFDLTISEADLIARLFPKPLPAGAEERELAEPAPPLSAAPDAVLLPVTEEPASPARDNALADLEPKLVTAAYQWLLKHVEQETKLAEQEDRQFHKLALTDSDLRQRCRAKTGATWRDYHAAFRKLPLEVRQKPRRSSTKR